MWRIYNPKHSRVPTPKPGDSIEVHYSYELGDSKDYVVYATTQKLFFEIGGSVSEVSAKVTKIIDASNFTYVASIPKSKINIDSTITVDLGGLQSVNLVREDILKVLMEYLGWLILISLGLAALAGGVIGGGSNQGQCVDTRAGEVCSN